MNILIALIPAISFGTMALLSSLTKGNTKERLLGITLGNIVFAVFFTLFKSENFLLCSKEWVHLWSYGILSGAMWTIGLTFQYKAIDNLSMSKAFPVSTASQLLLNAITGAIIYREWTTKYKLGIGFTALVILTIGAILTAYKESAEERAKNRFKGNVDLAISSFAFLFYVVICRIGNLDNYAMLIPQSIGTFLGWLVLAPGFKHDIKKVRLNIPIGFLWEIGNLCLFISIGRLGQAISFSLSQCGVVFSTFGALIFLKEHKTKKEFVFLVIGCLLIIAGAFILGCMKS